MASYLDTFLEKPHELAQEIRRELERGEEGGELTLAEKKDVEQALIPPTSTLRAHARPFHPRGEGGSGEMRRDIEREMREKKDAFGRDLEEVRDAGGERETGWGNPSHLEETENTSEPESSWSMIRREQDDFRGYCEANFRLINSTLVALRDRVNRLEAQNAPSIPLAQLPSSPPRGHRSSPSRDRTDAAKGPVPSNSKAAEGAPTERAGGAPSRVPLDLSVLERFLRANRSYPSLSGVRKAKLSALMQEAGVNKPLGDLPASEWNKEGLTKWLEK